MNYLKIKKNNDFQRLFKRGKKVFSPYLTLLYYPSDRLCMGLAVSKKHGKAHTRNRIKRLCREAFRLNCGELEKSYCIIIIPKVAESYDFDSVSKGIKICIKKINRCEK